MTKHNNYSIYFKDFDDDDDDNNNSNIIKNK